MFIDHTENLVNPTKGSSSRKLLPGLYQGKVVRVSGGVYVTIPTVATGSTFGPCKTFGNQPVLNQIVLCGFLDNRFDEVVIIAKETTSNVIKDVGTPSQNTDASNKLYVDTVIATLLAYVNQQLALKVNI